MSSNQISNLTPEDLLNYFEDDALPDFFGKLEYNKPQPAVVGDIQFLGQIIDRLCSFAKQNKLDFGQDLNSVFAVGYAGKPSSILIAAVDGDNNAVLEYALANLGIKADLAGFSAQSECGVTPLIRAIENGNADAAKLLIDHGATKTLVVGNKTPDGALKKLFAENHPNAARISELLHGKVPGSETASDIEAKAALGCAEHVSKLKRLQELVARFNHLADETIGLDGSENAFTTLLYTACRFNNARAVEYLLSMNADPAKPVIGDNTCLHVACFRGHVDIVRLLMNTGRVDPSAVNSLGEKCITCFKDTVSRAEAQEIVAVVNLPLIRSVLQNFHQGDPKNPNQVHVDKLKEALDLVPVDMLLDAASLAPNVASLVSSNSMNNNNNNYIKSKTYTTLLNELVKTVCEPAVELLLQFGADANGPFYGSKRKMAAAQQAAAAATATAASSAQQQPGTGTGSGGGGSGADGSLPDGAGSPLVGSAVARRPTTRGQPRANAADSANDAESTKERFTVTSLVRAFDFNVVDNDTNAEAEKVVLPLAVACELQHPSIGRLLVKWGADPALLGKLNHNLQNYFELYVQEKTRLQKAYEFVVGLPIAKDKQEWLTEFIQNPHPHKIDVDCPINEVGPKKKSLLFHAVEHSNQAAFDDLVATQQFDLSLTSYDASNDSLLHIAARSGCAHIVGKLLQRGVSPEVKNTSGQSPLDVTPASAQEVRDLLEAVLKKIETDRHNERVQKFCDSLPARSDPSAPNVRIVAGTFARTAEGTLSAIKDALIRAVEEFRRALPTGSPVAKLFRTSLAEKVLEMNQKTITSNINDFIGLTNQTQLFLSPLEEMFNAQIASAFGDVAPKVLQGFRHNSAERANAEKILNEAKNKLSSSSVGVRQIFQSTLPAMSKSLLDTAVAHWSSIAASEKLRRFSHTFLVRHLIPRAQYEWTYSEQFPQRWAETASTSILAQTTLKLFEVLGVTESDVSDFLNSNIIGQWSSVPLFSHAVSRLVVVDKQKMNPDKKLEQMEREIEKALHVTAKNAFESIRTSLVTDRIAQSVEEVNAAAVKTFFAELLPKVVSTEWVQTASAAGRELFQDSFPVASDLLSLDSIKSHCTNVQTCYPLLQALRKNLIDAKPPGTTKEAQSRFEGQTQILVDIGRNGLGSMKDLFDKILRQLQLHSVWRAMPMYAHSPELDHKISTNDVILVHAGTGSGKSVFMPQHLANRLPDHRIVVTQPRRIAVDCIGKRVRELFGATRAGFQVGGKENPSPTARLQFKTDALFVNDVFAAAIGNAKTTGSSQHDISFDNTVVVIDEVHERNPMIDLLILGVCDLIKSGKYKNMKLILASATATGSWFELTSKNMGLKWGEIQIDVSCPFKINEEAAAQLLGDPAASKDAHGKKFMSDVRAELAAVDARDIVLRDPAARVLVFLPNIGEVEAAHRHFSQNLTGNKIRSLALHGRTEGVEGKVKEAIVVFANNIAETSITIDGLNYVLDFNLSMGIDIDGVRNSRSLHVTPATESACLQRRGRTGRKREGTYRHYYDRSKWAKDAVVSFDTLPNESLLQAEMRVRYFFRKTLFKHCPELPSSVSSAYPTLGLGIAVRRGLNFDMIPSEASQLQIAATLNLTPNMWRCLQYAIDKKTCPLAIMWLSAMIESREPPTRSGKLADHHVKRFGDKGDQGVLLDIYQMFLEEKARVEAKGKEFDHAAVVAFCAKSVPAQSASASSPTSTSASGGKISAASNLGQTITSVSSSSPSPFSPSGVGLQQQPQAQQAASASHAPAKDSPLNPHWYENIHHRVWVVGEILQSVAKLDPSAWSRYSSWKWEDIEQALLAGYYENVASFVGHDVGTRDTYYHGKYHRLGPVQLSGLDMFNTSVLLEFSQSNLPSFCLYSLLERRGYKNYMRFCTSVSREAFRKACDERNFTITHCVCLVNGEWAQLKRWFGGANPTYRNCVTSQDQSAWEQWILDQGPNVLKFLAVQLKISGNPVDVADTLDEIGRDYQAMNSSNPNANPKVVVPCVQAFGMPPATLEMLEKADRQLANRFRLATSTSRSKQELRAAIHGGDDLQKGLAICNVLLNFVGVVVKGGFVRDVVVSGMSTFKDFDCEAPATLYTYENSDQVLTRIRDMLRDDFGLKFPDVFDSKLNKYVPCIYRDSFCTKYTPGTRKAMARFYDGSLELEIVSPWNDAYIPVQNMDFSCNNLKLDPGANEIRQSFPIMMTAMDIIGDLLRQDRRTACTRDAVWSPGGSDGLFKNKTLTATPGSPMQRRIEKFRKDKGFRFVESCIVSADDGTITLMHGTNLDSAQLILKSGFRPSTSGNLGPGVYFSRNLQVVELFASIKKQTAAILQVTVKLGNLLMLQERDPHWQTKYPHKQSAFLSTEKSWRQLEEWCVPDQAAPFALAAKIIKIEQVR